METNFTSKGLVAVPVYSRRSLRYAPLEKLSPYARAWMEREVVQELESAAPDSSKLYLMFGQRSEVLVHKKFLARWFPLLEARTQKDQRSYVQLGPALLGTFPYQRIGGVCFRDGNGLNFSRDNLELPRVRLGGA